MRLSSLGEKRQVNVPYEGEQLTVQFAPRAVNGRWLKRLQGLKSDDHMGFLGLLRETLVAWDILDDAGQPLEPTDDLIQQLPLDLVQAILEKIMEAMSPKKTNAGSSAAT